MAHNVLFRSVELCFSLFTPFGSLFRAFQAVHKELTALTFILQDRLTANRVQTVIMCRKSALNGMLAWSPAASAV